MRLSHATVLVTGANGFVGSNVCERLTHEGAEVRALVRRTGEAPALRGRHIDEVEGSFTDPDDAARACDGVDALVHCAATVGSSLEQAREVNVEGTRTIVSAAAGAGVRRIVHLSTAAVYAEDKPATVTEEAPKTEDESSPYAISKAEAESAARDAAGDARLVLLRPPAVLGAHPTSTWATKVPDRIRDGRWPLKRDGMGTFAWVHVSDLVSAVVRALEEEGARGPYNVVGDHRTWRDYVERVRSWFPDAPRPPRETGYVWVGEYATDRARRELGWAPLVTFYEAMDEMGRFRG